MVQADPTGGKTTLTPSQPLSPSPSFLSAFFWLAAQSDRQTLESCQKVTRPGRGREREKRGGFPVGEHTYER